MRVEYKDPIFFSYQFGTKPLKNLLLHRNVLKQIGNALEDKGNNPVKAIRPYIFKLEVTKTKLPLHV